MPSIFESLPREIRDQILGYCLRADGDIIPFPTQHERANLRKQQAQANGSGIVKEQLCVALLTVSQMIHAEAAEMLFGRNVVCLSCEDFYQKNKHIMQEHFWKKYSQYFRHITTQCRGDDVNSDELRPIIERRHKKPEALAGITPYVTPIKVYHDQFVQRAARVHIWKAKLLNRMNLKTLKINVTKFSCHSECCRKPPLESLASSMKDGYGRIRFGLRENSDLRGKRNGLFLTEVKVIGLQDEAERQIFRDCWGFEVQ